MRMKIYTLLSMLSLNCAVITTVAAEEQPKVNVGLLVHTYATAEQNGFGSSTLTSDDEDWSYGMNLSRVRVLFATKLTDKDFLNVTTELSAAVGLGSDKSASVKILDAQYSHKFADYLTLSAGKILVAYNRNGLQTAGGLMTNNYGYFQYAYNAGTNNPLGNDTGRDVGINLTGKLVEKFNYRLGVFSGRREFENTDSAPLRYAGRFSYDFLDADKYAGTNLGMRKTISLGAGFDTQGTYHAFGLDAVLDMPLSEAGSITANLAYSYITGGDDPTDKYSFADLIPEQNVAFAELGYYFKESKLQPWIKYELQQTKMSTVADQTVLGCGLNYFFNGYGSNVRLSYVARENSDVNKFYSQVWLQFQLFIF